MDDLTYLLFFGIGSQILVYKKKKKVTWGFVNNTNSYFLPISIWEDLEWSPVIFLIFYFYSFEQPQYSM